MHPTVLMCGKSFVNLRVAKHVSCLQTSHELTLLKFYSVVSHGDESCGEDAYLALCEENGVYWVLCHFHAGDEFVEG